MKKKTFDYIWSEIIEKSIYKVEKTIKEFSEKNDCDYEFRIKDKGMNQTKSDILCSYNAIRKHLKKTYHKSNEENLIDNHKIAACFCGSLLQNKVYTFRLDQNIPPQIACANYELAYTVSLGIIYALLIAQYKDIGRDDLAEKLQQQERLEVPHTSEGHDSYDVGRIHTLALNDIYGNEFDILTYSDMMFWIEYYNRQKLEGTLTPMPLSKKQEL